MSSAQFEEDGVTYVDGDWSTCSDFLFPQGGRCEDHFTEVGENTVESRIMNVATLFFQLDGRCFRVSAYKANYSDARDQCEREGAFLTRVADVDTQHSLAAHIRARVAEGWQHFQDLEYFWMGSFHDRTEWRWEEGGDPVQQGFTNWELKQSLSP